MIGEDDFFMQNADYHYGATDAEKMYGRNYESSDYVPDTDQAAMEDMTPQPIKKVLQMIAQENIALQEF